MYSTKSAARRAAWSETNNPFGKFSHHKKVVPGVGLENGTGDEFENPGVLRVNTERLNDHPSVNAKRSEMTPAHLPQSHTDPTSSSRNRGQEPGDNVDFIQTLSPTVTANDTPSTFTAHDTPSSSETKRIERELTDEKAPIDRTESTQNADDGSAPKKRRFAKFFGGKAQSRKEDIDDNNGKEKKKHNFTAASQIRATLFNSWINVLLIASPVGIALYYAKVNPVAVFVVNFIAIIPLAAMLSYATEEIALRVGEVLGGLLNASFGNAVELIVSIIALLKNQVLIVQTSLIGSMLSNLLLVMGMCFFAGGFNRIEQEFNMTVAQTAASILFLAVGALLIPTAFDQWANTGSTDRTNSSAPIVAGVAELSRATSIMLLVVYGCYLFFQLKSHSAVYNASGRKNKPRKDMEGGKERIRAAVPGKHRKARKAALAEEAAQPQIEREEGDEEEDEKEEPEEPKLSVWVAIGTLAASTVLVALNAEYLVDSINAITCEGGVSKNFVGLILLPIVGNAAEHATAVTVAIKDKMDLAIGVAVGSSMQIALLVLPFIVVLGWIVGKDDMTLYFDGFQIAILFVAVLLVNYLIQDGKSHWLEGVLLMTLYIIIAVAAWYYPTAPGLNDCAA